MDQGKLLLPGQRPLGDFGDMTDSEIATLLQDRNRLAQSMGLPGLGARFKNCHGIEWLVVGHSYIPDAVSVQRNGGQIVMDDPLDLMPVIGPENLPERLDCLVRELYHCTSKGFVFLDKVPHLRPHQAQPMAHSVSDTDHPDCIAFTLDAANLSETILAHELGHVWIRLMEDCEYDYYWADISEPSKIRLVNYVSSFVLDRRVNEFIAERGFDVSIIQAHQNESIANFALAVTLGHLPPYRFESVFTALVIANQILDRELLPVTSFLGQSAPLSGRVVDMMSVLRTGIPDIYALAEKFAGSVRRHGYRDRASIGRAIEECLHLAFDFAEIGFDISADLHHVPFVEPMTDKSPDFMAGNPVAAKLEAGKVMARNNLRAPYQYTLKVNPQGMTEISFLERQGQWTPPVVLQNVPPRPVIDHLDPRSPHFPGSVGNGHDPFRHLPPQVRELLATTPNHRRPGFPTNQPLQPQLPGPFDHLPAHIRDLMPPMPGHQAPVQAAMHGGFPPGFPRNLGMGSHSPGSPVVPPAAQPWTTPRVGHQPAVPHQSLPSMSEYSPPALADLQHETPVALVQVQPHRRYMAGEGLWLSRARLQEQLQGEHPYVYAYNNPVNEVDPLGMDSRMDVLRRWFTEGDQPYRVYGPDNQVTQDVRFTPTVQNCLAAYKAAGCPASFPRTTAEKKACFYHYHTRKQYYRDLTSLQDPSILFVLGSFGVKIWKGDGKLRLDVRNVAGLESATRLFPSAAKWWGHQSILDDRIRDSQFWKSLGFGDHSNLHIGGNYTMHFTWFEPDPCQSGCPKPDPQSPGNPSPWRWLFPVLPD